MKRTEKNGGRWWRLWTRTGIENGLPVRVGRNPAIRRRSRPDSRSRWRRAAKSRCSSPRKPGASGRPGSRRRRRRRKRRGTGGAAFCLTFWKRKARRELMSREEALRATRAGQSVPVNRRTRRVRGSFGKSTDRATPRSREGGGGREAQPEAAERTRLPARPAPYELNESTWR